MKSSKILFVLSAVILFTNLVYCQEDSDSEMSIPEGGYEFAANLSSVTIPFKISDNLIVIQTELNGKIFNLILDSGMPIDGAVLFGSSKADSANLQFAGQIPIGGVDGKVIQSDLSMGAVLKVPNLKLTNQMIIVMPKDERRSMLFEGKDGVIGFSFFSKLIVEIDYEKFKMTLTQPEFFDAKDKGEKIPIDVRGNRIFVNAIVNLESGPPINSELVIDTGNRSALVLNTTNKPELVLPSKYISYFASSLSGKMPRKAGRIKSIQLGSYKLDNLVSSFNDGTHGAPPPWEKEGNLGNQTLQRFNVVFDIPGKNIYLKKNIKYREPFEFNMTGLQFEREDSYCLAIISVVPDSPAGKASLAEGDKILEINGKPVSRITSDMINDEFYKLGSDLKMVIERGGKRINVNLKLERVI